MPTTSFIERLSEYSDEQLLGKMRTGDIQAFNELFARHSRRAVELATTIVEDHFTAEEIVSDVFFSFWVRRQELPSITRFQPYLFTAIRYRSRKMLNTQNSGASIVSLEEYPMPPKDSPIDPLLQLQAGELANTIHEVIAKLPAQRKLIFTLNRIDGLSYKAIAVALNISESTVKNQLAAAFKTLRKELSVYPHSILSLSFFFFYS